MSIPAEVALRIAHHPVVERLGMSPAANCETFDHDNLRRALDPVGRAILDGLETEGAFATSLEALGLDDTDPMTRDADDLRGILSERASTQNRSILGASAEDFAPRPDLFRWGLNARLLDVVEAYLGRPCAYDGVEFHYSRADGKTVSTRRWHRDREDMKQVKVILYVNDVDEEGGPFEIVHPQAQPSLDERLKWRYAIVDDGHFHSALPSKGCVPPVKTFTGARGTVLFVDTARCHHHGKPPTRDDRAAVFFGYYSRNPAHPYCCERSPVGRAQRVEWAAPLSERQRACALWRDSLPLQSRLIPRNRMII